MRGLAIHIALLINIAYCTSYNNLPSSVTLSTNEQREDFTISRKGNGDAYSFNGYGMRIIGASGATYELKADNGVTTFFSKGGFSLTQATFALTGYHTLVIESGGISVGANSNFSYISSTQNIGAGGTEYGGNPKVRFNTGTSLTLGANARATFSDMTIFIHDGAISLSQGANLTIEATKAIRFQESLTNNGGTITINGNAYNIGGKRGIVPNDRTTIANFHSTNGTIIVNGDFYNGGQADNAVDTTGSAGGFNVYDPAFGGGGNLSIYGGSMRINGKLISTRGGDGVWGGDIINAQNSSISIYGGTLTTTGGVQNLSGSTLTIGAKDGVMGKIVGSVTNTGEIIINAAGAGSGNHNFITGNLTGGGSISLINGNNDFANATLTNGNKTLSVVKNDDKINAFKMSLNANQSATLGAFGEGIYTISGASSANLKNTANGINRATFGTFYATPLAMIDTLNADFSSTPKRKTATRKIITQRTKSQTRQTRQTRQIRQIRSVSNANPNDINGGFILKGISTNGASGVLGGLKAGYGVDFANARFALNLAYAYGSVSGATKGDIATFATSTKSHNFALNSQLNTRFVGNFGFDLGVSGAVALTNSTRKVESTAISVDSTLKSAQNLYQIAVDSVFLYDFKIRNFTITPYLGLRQGYIAMPKFSESGGGAFVLNAEAYNAYFLDALLGAKMGFDFGNYGAILADLEYKFLAYKTQKERIFRYENATQSADILRFAIPNAHKISVDLGYHKDFNRWYLRIDGNFSALINASKANDTNMNFYAYGISAKFGWRF